jgi:hypothetical protein
MTSKVYPVEPSLIFLFIWGVFHWGDKRFGDDWPGRIPAQMIAHILYYFSDQSDLVFDPMAGGGVVADTCLARPPHSAWQEGGHLTGNAGALIWTIGRIHDRKLNPVSGISPV